MIGIIIQARTGSTRLKNKVLKKIFNEYSILDLMINNLKTLKCKIIIATTFNQSDKDIVKIAIKHQVDYFCGDESNVLKRFINCAKEFKISKIIRVCADNVFIQPQFLSKFIKFKNKNYEYMSYKVGEINSILSHWGLFGEYVTLKALQKVSNMTENEVDLENVTYYIYSHSSKFEIKYFNVPNKLKRSDIRLTIDTINDFEICKKIIYFLEKNKLNWDYENILKYIDKNPSILEEMQLCIKRHEKVY